jgi:hypothetical protein
VNSRERYLETLLFGRPDRVPFMPGGPRESTLAAWWRQGMPPEGNWFDHLCRAIGVTPETTKPQVHPGVSFRMIPEFEEKVLEHRPGSGSTPGHLIVQDWMGNVVEISDEFDVTYLRAAKDFVTRRWHKFPVETPADFEEMKKRYDPRDPGRFPENWKDRVRAMRERDYVTSIGFAGPFWQLREWCGFEPLCVLMASEPEFVHAMVDFWSEFVSRTMEPILEAGIVDRVFMNEDMAYKAHPMIGPAMTRKFLAPAWKRWSTEAKQGGARIVDMDSDGCVDLLIPIWIESGINVCDPMEVAAGCDINGYRNLYGKQIAYTGGVDKRCMAKGGRVIEEELRRIEPVLRDGGFIPSCDHGVPSDVSWPDFIHYSRLLAEMTGWL